ncbi:Endonuclease/Exonuclease/phosphatase family protein [Flavobacterium sp. TAB 87]|nr:Endonuclease/Exonuclease/phosphatase family protein [Flavobacterium sp. TAB 87]
MAFRIKANYILGHHPDILIIPECEHPDKLRFQEGTILPSDTFLYGSNKNKGLGVFSYSDFKLQLIEQHNTQFKNVIPLRVFNDSHEFTMLAIWANNPQDKDGAYITQVWKAINFYENILGEKTILIGDFNSNTIWDKARRIGNHSCVVEKLEEKNILSTYHQFYNCEQGKELHPTLYMYRHQTRPYHIDYCFASSDLIRKLIKVEVGQFDEWIHFSDHSPLIVEFDLQKIEK